MTNADKAPDIVHLKNRLHSNIMGCPSYTTVEERQDCLAAIEQLQAENSSLQEKLQTALQWDDMESARNEQLQAENAALKNEVTRLYSASIDINRIPASPPAGWVFLKVSKRRMWEIAFTSGLRAASKLIATTESTSE